VARSCSRERTLSEYVRAEAQDGSRSRGTEKNRKVVMPHASPRVGANVTAMLKEGMCVCTAVRENAIARLVKAHFLLMFGFMLLRRTNATDKSGRYAWHGRHEVWFRVRVWAARILT
jgi:hypothetical protein